MGTDPQLYFRTGISARYHTNHSSLHNLRPGVRNIKYLCGVLETTFGSLFVSSINKLSFRWQHPLHVMARKLRVFRFFLRFTGSFTSSVWWVNILPRRSPYDTNLGKLLPGRRQFVIPSGLSRYTVRRWCAYSLWKRGGWCRIFYCDSSR